MDNLREILTNLDSVQIAMYSLYFLMLVIVVMVIYLISYYVESETVKEEKKEFDLYVAQKALEQMDNKPRVIKMDEYEKNQEDTAIISYDELLEQTMNMPAIFNEEIEKNENYNEEYAPISIEEYEQQKVETNVNISEEEIEEELSMTKEMVYLKDLKEFRANLK